MSLKFLTDKIKPILIILAITIIIFVIISSYKTDRHTNMEERIVLASDNCFKERNKYLGELDNKRKLSFSVYKPEDGNKVSRQSVITIPFPFITSGSSTKPLCSNSNAKTWLVV